MTTKIQKLISENEHAIEYIIYLADLWDWSVKRVIAECEKDFNTFYEQFKQSEKFYGRDV